MSRCEHGAGLIHTRHRGLKLSNLNSVPDQLIECSRMLHDKLLSNQTCTMVYARSIEFGCTPTLVYINIYLRHLYIIFHQSTHVGKAGYVVDIAINKRIILAVSISLPLTGAFMLLSYLVQKGHWQSGLIARYRWQLLGQLRGQHCASNWMFQLLLTQLLNDGTINWNMLYEVLPLTQLGKVN